MILFVRSMLTYYADAVGSIRDESKIGARWMWVEFLGLMMNL